MFTVTWTNAAGSRVTRAFVSYGQAAQEQLRLMFEGYSADLVVEGVCS